MPVDEDEDLPPCWGRWIRNNEPSTPAWYYSSLQDAGALLLDDGLEREDPWGIQQAVRILWKAEWEARQEGVASLLRHRLGWILYRAVSGPWGSWEKGRYQAGVLFLSTARWMNRLEGQGCQVQARALNQALIQAGRSWLRYRMRCLAKVRPSGELGHLLYEWVVDDARKIFPWARQGELVEINVDVLFFPFDHLGLETTPDNIETWLIEWLSSDPPFRCENRSAYRDVGTDALHASVRRAGEQGGNHLSAWVQAWSNILEVDPALLGLEGQDGPTA